MKYCAKQIRSGVRLVSIALLAAVAVNSGVLGRELAPHPAPRIQWLQEDGHLIDVGWASHARWIWKESAKGRSIPGLELTITPPQQIRVVGSDDPRVTLVKTQEFEGHSTLVIDARYPAFTAKVYVDSGDGAAKKAGLVIAFSEQRAIVNDSCAEIGVELIRSRAPLGPEAFYMGADCRRTRDGVEISLKASENVLLTGSDGSPLEIENQASLLKLNRSESRAGVKIARADGHGSVAEYNLVLRRSAAESAQRSARKGGTEAASVSQLSAEAITSGRSAISVALLPTHLSYRKSAGAAGVDPSEFGLVLDARMEIDSVLKSSPSWEINAQLPLVSVIGGPAGMPAGGAYMLAARAAPDSWSWGRDGSFQLMAGASVQYLRFGRRADASGLLFGPEVALVLKGKSVFFSEGVAHRSRLWLAPLLGRGNSPVFSSLAAGGNTSFEVLGSGARRRLDFEIGLKYYSVEAASGESMPAISVSTGFRLWL